MVAAFKERVFRLPQAQADAAREIDYDGAALEPSLFSFGEPGINFHLASMTSSRPRDENSGFDRAESLTAIIIPRLIL